MQKPFLPEMGGPVGEGVCHHMSNGRSCLLYIHAYTGGSAPRLYVCVPGAHPGPILPQNQLPVADGSLVLAQRPFLDP